MKKDRNSFFSEYNMNAYNTAPMMPYPNQVASQSSFYSGPAYDPNIMNNMNNPTNNNMNNNYTNDLESRISKLERHINRLETRINKLENGLSNFNPNDLNDSTYNNMYMV